MATTYKEIRFKRNQPGDFFDTLNKRVDEYFNSKGITRKANAYGKFKALLIVGLYLGLLGAIYFAGGRVWLMLTAFTLLGFIQICFALILGHEGVHNSFSESKRVNKMVSYAFDFVGTSGYLWGLRHVHSHHPYPMIPGHDTDIAQVGLLTFSPMENPKKMFRFQHIYSPFLYLFYTLTVVFRRDFIDFFSNRIGNKEIKHKTKEYVALFLTKAFYFTHVLVLPLILSGCSWGWVLLGFVMMHFMESITAAVALFPAHIHEDSVFPLPDENNEMQDTWAEHQVRVTTDFGTRWNIVGFFFGGINYHAVHHLFPAMSHVHFHPVQKILIETCDEFGIKHNVEPHLHKAIISHIKLLKKNGVSHKNIHHLAEVI